jgi:hypothetical protein
MINKWLLIFGGLVLMSMTAIGNAQSADANARLLVGWAQGDITPTRPAALGGMGYLRISKEVSDPLTVTAMALEAPYQTDGPSQVIIASADLTSITPNMMAAVRNALRQNHPEIDPSRVMLSATHSHTAPPLSAYGQQTDAMVEPEYMEWAAPRIAATLAKAWNNRQPGGISYGLSHAVVAHNRVVTYTSGEAKMYGKVNQADFSHIEGFEDHALHLLFTWNAQGKLTGVLLNTTATAQTRASESVVSADYWHETRVELRKRLGEKLFVLPQVSSAGDQAPTPLVDARAEKRMEKLTGRTRRDQVAQRLADGVMAIYDVMQKNIEWSPVLRHRTQIVKLPRRQLTAQDKAEAQETIVTSQADLDKFQAQLQANPALAQDTQWMRRQNRAGWHLSRAKRVLAIEEGEPFNDVELHALRLGDVAFTFNPFELYLDYGVRIKARSKAVQTFVVELANAWYLYLPTERSIAGRAYGATPPSSRHSGPEAGKLLVEWAVENINALWDEPKNP